MAPLEPNSTGRVFVEYIANGRGHTVSFRYTEDGPPPSGTLEAIDEFLIACNALMPEDWTFDSWRYQARGSDISLPLGGSPTPFDGLRTPRAYELPAFVSVIGRSTLGRRARIYLLGAGFDASEDGGLAANYRLTAAESAVVTAVVAAAASASPVAVDNSPVNWYNYLNVGYHSYWQRAARG